MKSTVKLQMLGEGSSDNMVDDILLDVGRALYKLHFQLLLLLEACNKMVGALASTAKKHQVSFL